MGWASGADIAQIINDLLIEYVPRSKWREAATPVKEQLEDMDWDTQEEGGDIFEVLALEEYLADSDNESDGEEYHQEVRERLEEIYERLGGKF